MQQQNDFFSKVIALKTIIIAIMVSLLIVFAVVGIVMTFSSNSELFGLISKVVAPLGVFGVMTILSVDCFHKMAHDEKIVKILGLFTLITGFIAAVLWTLFLWEIIPMYETVAKSDYISLLSFTAPTPSIAYKLTMSLISLTSFTFLSSIVLSIKNNHKLINLSKRITVGFLAIACITSITSNFIEFSQDLYAGTRIGFLQAIAWITALFLGATTFYLSKTTSWEEKDIEGTSPESKTPTKQIEPAPVLLATAGQPTTEVASTSAQTTTGLTIETPISDQPINQTKDGE